MTQKITGYRELSGDELALVNEIKELAESVGVMVNRLKVNDHDQRWVSIGATDLQTGFMALIRSITKPTTF